MALPGLQGQLTTQHQCTIPSMLSHRHSPAASRIRASFWRWAVELLVAGHRHTQLRPGQRHRTPLDPHAAAALRAHGGVEQQRGLAAGHRQVDLGQDLGVEQGAVEDAVAIVDLVALAQRIQAVALAGMLVPRHLQGIEDAAMLGHRPQPRLAADGVEHRQLMVDEAHVEGRVVDHQFGTFDEGPEVIDDLGEDRLIGDPFVGDTVHGDRLCLDLPLGIDELMVGTPGEPAVDHLHRADLDQPVALPGVDTRGLCIKHYLPHRYSLTPAVCDCRWPRWQGIGALVRAYGWWPTGVRRRLDHSTSLFLLSWAAPGSGLSRAAPNAEPPTGAAKRRRLP